MATIFISHSNFDDPLASTLGQWLKRHGFDDFFMDHASVRGGDKWMETLRRAKGACRAVVCIVTEHWLASDECFGEFVAAWYMGRRIIPLLAVAPNADLPEKERARLKRVLIEDQGVNIAPLIVSDSLNLDARQDVSELLQAGLRAAGALARVGLDPYAFEIEPDLRPDPFPGLASFSDTDADAAIFFGRSQEIARCLEDLRALRATGDRRAYVLIGASGSGKSSLMKAGVLPRLRRERGWFVLRAFRPGSDPLLNFAQSVALTGAALHIDVSPGTVRDRLLQAWRDKRDLRTVLEEIVAPLKAGGDRANATTLIPIDQGEEFVHAQGDSAEALFALMRAVLAEVHEGEPAPYALMFTFRSDSFREFETLKGLEGIETRVQNVKALPEHRFEATIEQPAARYGVKFEPELTDALAEDAQGQDALPLLAFTLQRLWRQYKSEGVIRQAHYDAIRKLSGIIEDASERALRGLDPERTEEAPGERISEARAQAAARLFIPSLAQLNERGGVVRRRARLADLSEDQNQIVNAFVKWRLMVKSQDNVEVTHEAIFREWPRLRDWIFAEKERLEALRGLERAAEVWAAKGRSPDDLTHRGKRLAEARALAKIDDYRIQIERDAETRPYLDACIKAQQRGRLLAGAVAAGVGLAVLLAVSIPAILDGLRRAEAERRHQAAVEAAAAYQPTSLVLDDGRAANDLAPGAVFRDCADCPELVVIPAGAFMMGSPPDEVRRGRDEGPQRRVAVPSFAMGKFDVTFDEWDACVAARGCEAIPVPIDYHAGRGRRPLIAVSWHDAQRYARWMSRKTGERYRLPTEAEWEYAARAGSPDAYYTGPDITHEQANFDAVILAAEPVGTYPPNAFGLYDMAGSVWQWVEDCYIDTYDGAPDDGSARIQRGCTQHIIRGGSWANPASDIRSAARYAMQPTGTPDHGGFRVVRELGARRR